MLAARAVEVKLHDALCLGKLAQHAIPRPPWAIASGQAQKLQWVDQAEHAAKKGKQGQCQCNEARQDRPQTMARLVSVTQ